LRRSLIQLKDFSNGLMRIQKDLIGRIQIYENFNLTCPFSFHAGRLWHLSGKTISSSNRNYGAWPSGTYKFAVSYEGLDP
jgi:hypothetical protein